MQASYLPGQAATVIDNSSGNLLGGIHKAQHDICKTQAQRSLLVRRESLRCSSQEDWEQFILHANNAMFTAKRTYPGTEVDIVAHDGRSCARMSRQDYLKVAQVRPSFIPKVSACSS